MSESDVTGETEEAIMLATYRALCDHGYAGTTISAIGDEFEKSKSLLYYHYEDKEALLESFLRYILDEFESNLEAVEDDTPRAELWAIVDQLLPPEMDEEDFQFWRAIQETRANTPHSSAYHDQFARSDELILERLTDTIASGVEDGSFHEVDPEETAQFLYSTFSGGLERGITLGDDEPIDETRKGLENYLEEVLFREE
ncbi:MAG: TetR/AcrR family transcriptional regulator [Halobaculum sp.]